MVRNRRGSTEPRSVQTKEVTRREDASQRRMGDLEVAEVVTIAQIVGSIEVVAL